MMWVRKYADTKIAVVDNFVRPALAMGVAICISYAGYLLGGSLIGETAAFMLAAMTAGILYIVMLFMLKGLTRDDVLMLPGGKRIVRWCKWL